jgi:hypothetical protein
MKRLTVIPWLLWAVIAAFAIAFIFHAGRASAAPTFGVQDKGITIVFYDEPCALTEHVANLPHRAVWKEAGKTYEGCFGTRPDYEVVVAYFSDKTFALIPFAVIKKLADA